jgi:hypothetical protein
MGMLQTSNTGPPDGEVFRTVEWEFGKVEPQP